MNTIQVITNDWIDTLLWDKNTNIIIRKTNNDKGIIKDILDNKLYIIWDIWGIEEFTKINNIYYNLKSEIFEIFLESDYWNDICIFNVNNQIIYRKNNINEIGKFIFNNNDLNIVWNNYSNEVFYQLNYGKIYTNKTFGKLIKNSIHKHIKIIAIVFPQFHEIPENNKFWGTGFTEWTLLRNIPRVVNGEIIRQPHNDIGYFNLNDYSHRKYMRQLADKFNIFGFCYYHYWFKNKKVMYEPTELMLKDGEPNKPFLFCWANEQWTKRWDGGNNEILIEQDYSDIDGNISHFNYLLDFFKNKNYIKKCGKPIFIFYRIEEKYINDINNIIKIWNNLALENNLPGIHFMKFLGPFNNSIFLENINGYVEFQPGYASQTFSDIISEDNNKIFNEDLYDEDLYLKKNIDVKELIEKKYINNGFEHYQKIGEKERKFRTSKFNVFDGSILYEKILQLPRVHNEIHRGISLNWNNTPRRNYTSTEYDKYPHYYKNIDHKLFKSTFTKLLKKIDNDPNKDDDFLFISAWNEWNEQAILEPNNYDGYSYLKSLSDAYLEFYNYPIKKNILNICHKGGGTHKYMNDLKNYYNDYNFIDFGIFNADEDYDKLYNNIDTIHINSILFNNLKNNYIYLFTNYFKNVPKIITIHDFQWIFPDNPNIIKEILFLNEPINLNNFDKLLSLCDKIIFPSHNIYNNYLKFIDFNKYKDKINVINHFDKIMNHDFFVIPSITQFINIAFIGYYTDYKGSRLFNELALRICLYKDYSIKYHIFGNINKNIVINNINNNIIIHNEYNDNEIINKLYNNNIHGLVHLSLFEESYCYALTNSINSGLPIFYMNRGSICERLVEQNKYIGCELNDIYERFNYFIEFIISNGNNKNIYTLNDDIQPNRWYIENY